jgi:hypothetical protein
MYYTKIIEYFLNLAKSHEAFMHEVGNRQTFFAGDFDDFKRGEIGVKEGQMIMIADYDPSGIGRAISSYVINETQKNQQTLRFNLAIYKNCDINKTMESVNAIDKLYEVAHSIIEIMLENRTEDCYYRDLLLHMEPEVMITRAPVIGNSRFVGLVLSFNFKFYL